MDTLLDQTTPETQQSSTWQIRGGTILIVDDAPTNLDILFKYLDKAGFKVLVADNGHGAILRAKRTRPDIILLDVMMPDLDGFETCRRLKAEEITRDIPVIFMTALTDIKSKVRGFEVGGVDYVTKPVEYQEVLARVNTHMMIHHLQKSLRQEIIERKKANEDLETFAYTVSRSLRSPLGLIIGYGELLDQQARLPDNLQYHLNAVLRNAQKMNNMVDELQVLAGVRKANVELRPLNMARVVADAQQRLAYLIEESQAEFIMPEYWPIALGYGPWVEEVWTNYLSNGIKYGGEPPRLKLGATEGSNSMVRFWVQDNGPGLSLEEQANLFQPFTRLSQVQARGHGLGLSIVRRIVERLGGEVGVSSEQRPGQGCTFSFTLPKGE